MMLLLHGACATTCIVIALFFVRYWRASSDRLFVFFGAAFAMLALHWVGLALLNPADDERHWLYAFRLVAFSSIIAGVIDKNRRAGTK